MCNFLLFLKSMVKVWSFFMSNFHNFFYIIFSSDMIRM
nr:MAG TPA: hypothetical protein [Caudoviricetes sp.]